MTTSLLCKERLTANLFGILRIMAGGRRRVLRQFTGVPSRRRRTAPTHQADAAVLSAPEGPWLMRLQVNVTFKKKNLFDFGVFLYKLILHAFNHFPVFYPSTSTFVPHPAVADVQTFCNNPKCFLKFNVSTWDNRQLFKGLGHHVKIETNVQLSILLRPYLLYMLWRFITLTENKQLWWDEVRLMSSFQTCTVFISEL